MATRDTGFHPTDADWTRGRALAAAEAESLARRQISMTRRVTIARAAELEKADE